MSKQLGDAQQSNSRYMGKGIFVDKIKIKRVEDYSKYPTRPDLPVKSFESGKTANELCIKVVYDGGDKERSLYFFGNFKYKNVDRVSGKKDGYLGWDQYRNAVQSFIYRVTGKVVLGDDDTLLSENLKRCEGKEIYTLRYCDGEGEGEYAGKPHFASGKFVMPATDSDGEQVLYEDFLKKPPKDYDPVLYDAFQKSREDDETHFDPSKYTEDVV